MVCSIHMEINFPLLPMQPNLQSYLPGYNLFTVNKTYGIWKTAFNMQLEPVFTVADPTSATF